MASVTLTDPQARAYRTLLRVGRLSSKGLRQHMITVTVMKNLVTKGLASEELKSKGPDFWSVYRPIVDHPAGTELDHP